jgi:nitroreductase
MFLPDKPVPRDLIDEALALAMRAPSTSNASAVAGFSSAFASLEQPRKARSARLA